MPTKTRRDRARSAAAGERATKWRATSWRDAPETAELETRAALQRRRLREAQEARLRANRRDAYEPWQRGLIGAVDVYVRRMRREAIAAEARRAALRRRQAEAAVLRRAGMKAPKGPALPVGAPKTAKNFIVGCAVSAWLNGRGRVTYREIAGFIVDSLAPHFIPADLRAPLLRGRSAAEQKARLADQIRRAKSRQT